MRDRETSIDAEAVIFHEGHGGTHTADYVPDVGRVVLRHWDEDGTPCECDAGSGVVDTPRDGDIVWHRADDRAQADAAADWVFKWAADNPCIDGYRYSRHQHTYRADINDWWCETCDTVTDYCDGI